MTTRNFAEFATRFLARLGYTSTRTLPGQSGLPADFIAQFPAPNPDTKSEREFVAAAVETRVLFQFTSDEVASQAAITEGFDRGDEKSFLFLGVRLRGKSYPRGQYAKFTREVNKRFNAAPCVVLFLSATNLQTIAFVRRRQHKHVSERSVLDSVSLIREIELDENLETRAGITHRAHIDILAELALRARHKWMTAHNEPFNFDGLLTAWLAVLDTEELNKKFFGELFAWFERAVAAARFPRNQAKTITPQEHIIRLLTRLLFIWFIKEKGLVAPELFNETAVTDLLRDYDRDTGDSYYRAVLQNLFFATLNTEIDKRGFSGKKQTTHRNFSRYRFKDEMRDANALLRLFKRTPFINGGLFDCLDSEVAGKDGYRIDCFSDNVIARGKRDYRILSVPNRLFFDDNTAALGLINLFERYKFTVEENTPIEQEVALDPELLGKVFENLLAAYNPETQSSARRMTGSYYTPRAVVDYMADEALVEAIAGRCKAADGDAEFLRERLHYLFDFADAFDDADELFEADERKAVITAIAHLKILDPAVGSGAFPMGALHKLTLALRRLDADNRHWQALQKELATERAAAALDAQSKKERDAALAEIGDTFARYRGPDFGRKLYLIQNSIFGVDIQPIACQIAKLRFFISLAIEQRPTADAAANYGIKPLPNLETRFVAGDTLLRLQKPVQKTLGYTAEVEALEADIRKCREAHFHADNREEKRAQRERDRKLRAQLATVLEKSGFPAASAGKIAAWDPYDQNAVADWFDAEYMFGVTDGFDVVIGNPPYIQLQKGGGKLGKRYAASDYGTFARRGDIYQLFYEAGCKLLARDGHLCYITSNKWMRARYGEKTRHLFTAADSAYRPRKLLDFGGHQVFENATVDTCILLVKRLGQDDESAAALRATAVKGDFQKGDNIAEYASANAVSIAVTADTWFIGSAAEVALKQKIERVGTPLKEWDISIYMGLKTGRNEAFIVNTAVKNALVADDPKSAELLKPVLRGRDINRYRADWAGLWLIYAHSGMDIDAYPGIKRHLSQYRRTLEEKAGKAKWYELQLDYYNSGAYRLFARDKIVYSEIVQQPQFYLDDGTYFPEATVFILTGDELNYLIGIFHSDLFTYAFKNFYAGGGLGAAGYRYKKRFMEAVPVPPVTASNRVSVERIKELTTAILDRKAGDANADTGKMDAEVNQLVYALYDFSAEDIAVVEGGE